MTDLLPLLKETGAYKRILADKSAHMLSHAYLIISADKANLGEYLKLFAKLIIADPEDDFYSRAEYLISNDCHPDVYFFPKNGDSVMSEDISTIISESFLKPIEGDKKIFIINGGETMNASSQNKLLKTLEEPPSGVHILIGATSEFPLLSTLKSRVKKLVIPPFPADKLFTALKAECQDEAKLAEAIACSDKTVGNTLALYGDENLSATISLATETFCNMRSSRNVLEFSGRIMALNDGVSGYLSVMATITRDLMASQNGGKAFDGKLLDKIKTAEGFTQGAVIYIADKIAKAQRRLAANGNKQAVLEDFLFAFLEGKHKWRKS